VFTQCARSSLASATNRAWDLFILGSNNISIYTILDPGTEGRIARWYYFREVVHGPFWRRTEAVHGNVGTQPVHLEDYDTEVVELGSSSRGPIKELGRHT